MAAATRSDEEKFPSNGVALDSWANVWMRHLKGQPDTYYGDNLRLAHGTCPCHKQVMQKGVPSVQVPWQSTGDNIDLFPEGWLWERGCEIHRGSTLTVRSPKGREIKVKMWGSMPWVTKDELNQLLSDLPDHSVPGRSGKPAAQPTVARVALANTPDLSHMVDHFPKEDVLRMRSKYRNLPDRYYNGDKEKFITPARFDEKEPQSSTADVAGSSHCGDVTRSSRQRPAIALWELCAGSSVLSAMAKKRGELHLPPIDMRFQWYTGRRFDQVLVLWGILFYSIKCLFASPNCALWGLMMSRIDKAVLNMRRNRERPSLKFLALCCMLQVWLGNSYLSVNSGASKIFNETDLQVLSRMGQHTMVLDQCMYDATLEGLPIKKASAFKSKKKV